MKPGFFVLGGTLRSDAPSYVHRKADDELSEGLGHGDFCYVLTSRQMGKSSLMLRAATRLRADGVAVVILDLTALGQNLTAEQWYDGLVSSIAMQLNLEIELEAFWGAHGRLGPMKRCLEAIRAVVLERVAGQVVIFVDEIDAVRSLPFSSDEFFAGIRELYNRRTDDRELRRLTFCLLGVATPSDLIRDTRTTPFNVGRRIELNDFSDAEALPLADGLGREATLGRLLLKRILHWTGGHPYLTQRLCHAVAERADVVDSRGIDSLCSDLFFSPRARERDDNLLFVRERLLRSEVEVAGLLDLYTKVRRRNSVRDDETNPVVSVLRLSGIVRVLDTQLRVRNRIYDRVFDSAWIVVSMPDAERRRQASAYRRGLLRAGAVAAIVVAAVGSLAAYAVKQRAFADEERLRAEAEQRSGRRVLYAAQINLAARDWEAGNITHMWDLLSAQRPKVNEPDPRGFEWHYLWRLSHGYTVSLGEQGLTSSLALSSDGTRMAIGDTDGTVKLWNLETNQHLQTLRFVATPSAPNTSQLEVRHVAFSADGKSLAAAAGVHVRVFATDTGLEKASFTYAGGAAWLELSPDGRWLIFAARFSLKLWNVESNTEARIADASSKLVVGARFTNDGRAIQVVTDTTVAHLNLATAQQTSVVTLKQRLFTSNVGVAFSPDDRTFACWLSEGSLALLDATTGDLLWTKANVWPSRSPNMFSPNGEHIAVPLGNVVSIFDARTGRTVGELKERGHVTALAYAPGGQGLYIGTGEGTTRLWPTQATSNSVSRPNKQLTEFGFSQDGTNIVVASYIGSIEDIDVAHGRVVAQYAREKTIEEMREDSKRATPRAWPSPPTLSARVPIAILPTQFARADGRNLRRWDRLSSRELPPLTLAGSDDITHIALGAGGMLAAANSAGLVELWDLGKVKLLRELKGQAGGPMVFSPDAKLLVTSGLGRDVQIWSVTTGGPLVTLKGHGAELDAVTFSPDGLNVLTGNWDRTARLWDARTGRELQVFRGHAGALMAVAFSADSKRIATGSADGTAKLWDPISGQELLTLRGHTQVTGVAFSPNGQSLATIGSDGLLRLWSAQPEKHSPGPMLDTKPRIH